jgi:hypothetical protein
MTRKPATPCPPMPMTKPPALAIVTSLSADNQRAWMDGQQVDPCNVPAGRAPKHWPAVPLDPSLACATSKKTLYDGICTTLYLEIARCTDNVVRAVQAASLDAFQETAGKTLPADAFQRIHDAVDLAMSKIWKSEEQGEIDALNNIAEKSPQVIRDVLSTALDIALEEIDNVEEQTREEAISDGRATATIVNRMDAISQRAWLRDFTETLRHANRMELMEAMGMSLTAGF